MVAFLPAQLCLPPVASGTPTLDTIHLADALCLMARIPAGSIDAIIADPPYDMTELDFEQAIDWVKFWREARRILTRKNSPVILFSQQPFTTDLICSNREGWRDEIIWEKSMPVGFLDANRRPLNCHENIQVFADAAEDYFPQMEWSNENIHKPPASTGAVHYNKHTRLGTWEDTGSRYPRSVWKFAQRNTAFKKTVTLHPTQKPLPLMERLILTYTQPGEIVLDPFAGSGSTLLAALKNGRRYIGSDTSLKYVTEARKRLAQPFTLSMFDQVIKPAPPVQREMFAQPAP